MPNGPSQTGVGRLRPALTNPRWPFSFVLFALLALGVLPFLTIGTIARYRAELVRIEQARTLATDQQIAQALGGGVLRNYLRTRDPQLLQRYHDAIADNQRARRALGQLVAPLAPAVQQHYEELVRSETLWQQRIADLLGQRPYPVERIEQVLIDEPLYEQALTATASLDRALSQAAAIERRKIDRAQRLALILTAALVALAAAAAAAVIWLGRRLSVFALTAEADRRELRLVLQARDRTTRGITHDLKNPLGVIVGHAELLEEGVRGELNPEQREDIGRIKRAAAAMLGLIDSLLELARVESGNISIHKTVVDLHGLISEVSGNYRMALERAVSLSIQPWPTTSSL